MVKNPISTFTNTRIVKLKSLLKRYFSWVQQNSLLITALILTLFYFKHAFNIGFFKDGLYFLNLSHAKNFKEFLHFFSPIKTFAYRPIPIELFYFLINRFHLSFTTIHIVIFLTFLSGIIALYFGIIRLTKNKIWAGVVVLLYATHLSHVFQLYAAWNFQEVCLFSFLSLSFWAFASKKNTLSLLFYTFALMSKESAIFFPGVILLIAIGQTLKKQKRILFSKNYLLSLIGLTLVFLLIYKYAIQKFEENPLYTIHLQPSLILNNLMWYFLWACGFPTYMPDYLRSVFSLPLPDFYKTFASLNVRLYFYLLLAFWFGLIVGQCYLWLKKHTIRIKSFYLAVFSAGCFVAFNALTLPIIHKWMVRLTLPLVFLSLYQAYLLGNLWKIGKIGRFLTIWLIVTYLSFNYFGTIVHEDASTINLESRIYFKSVAYFNPRRQEILKHNVIYLKDRPKNKPNPWGGSKKLYDTFWGQNFVEYLFPEKKMKMVFQFETPKIPRGSYIVPSYNLLPY